MADKTPGPNQSETEKEGPNRILGIAAIVLGAAIIAVLVGGGIFWLLTPAEQPLGGPAKLGVFNGELTDRIELAPGSLKDWNVLLISADTTRSDRVGCYGNQAIKTPAIDGLARQGVLFRHASTPVPITLPGHACMLTGLNPPGHGVRSNGLFRLRDEVKTLGTLLKARGYATGAAIGAYVLDRKFGLDRGFDTYDDDLTGGHSPTQYGYRERTAAGVNDVILPWIRRHAGEKFFCFVHYFDPHFPYKPPAPFDETYTSNPYDGEIAYVDTQVARLVGVLDELGLRQRTLVVFTSDHGESLGEHGERTHANLIYEATQHVPLIFSAPARLPQNRMVTRPVGTIDIVPTTLALLGAPIPDGLDGISLLDRPAPHERPLYLETLYPKLTHNWAPLLGVRRGEFKFIHAPQPEIYNVREDPHELSNLYASKQALAAELYDQLKVLLGSDPATAADVQGNLAVDAKTRAILQQLGYVVPSTTSAQAMTRAADLPDPKVMMQAHQFLVTAQNLGMEGRYKEAVEQIERYLQKSPRDPEGVQIAGQLYRQLGRLDESLKYYQKSATLGYEPAEAWAGIGSIYVLTKQLDKASEAYAKALEMDPTSTTALIGMGSVLTAQNKPAEAMAAFKTALERGQGINAGMIYLGISNIHRRAGRTKEAEDALAKALLAEPENPVLAKVAAGLSEKGGNVDQAIQRLRAAADGKPTTDVLLKLGTLLVQKEKYGEAETYLRKGISLDPNHVEMHYVLGRALLGLKQIKEAMQAFNTAHRLNPDYGPALTQMGIVFAQLGQFAESEKIMRRALQADPNSARAHYNLALVQTNLKKYDEAIKGLHKAIELDPRQPKFYTKLGLVYEQQGKKAEAIQQYRKALEVDPKDAEAIQLLKAIGGG